MADDPISKLCEAIRPIVRRQVMAAVGDREIHYDTDEIVRTILNNPEVVLHALGGVTDDDVREWPALEQQEFFGVAIKRRVGWWFPKAAG